MVALSRHSFVGIKKETVLGTYVAPTAIFIPTDGAPTPDDVFERIVDESENGNSSKVRGIYDGVHDGQIGWSGHLYPDYLGHFLAALGLADTISGAGPYVHTHKAPASTAQPPSYSIADFNTINTKGYPGQKLESLNLKVDNKGSVKYTVMWKGWKSTLPSTPTPAFTTAAPWLSWQAAIALNGAASARVLTTDLTISRGTVECLHTEQNSQDPYTVFSGDLEAKWKFKALFEDEADLDIYLNNTQGVTSLTLTAPASGPVVVFTTTKNGPMKGTVDRSGTYAAVDLEFEGIYSATDAGPIAAVLTNSIAVAS